MRKPWSGSTSITAAKPRAADSERLTTSDIVKLNGKSYLFNHLGNPVYGLKKVYTGSGEDDWTAFYFGDKNKSCVQKGKMKVTEDDGNKSDFTSWTMDGASMGLRITTYTIRGNSRRQRTARSMYATGWRAGIMWSTLPVRL